ncbi:MAG: LysM peptidoglycan-binding domain-containing protein [Caldilineaceae bacterium]
MNYRQRIEQAYRRHANRATTCAIPTTQQIVWMVIFGLLGILLLWSLSFTTVTTALAQSICGETVTVVAGDTLREIANRCNTTVAELLTANPGVRNRNLIYPGQVLTIPGSDDVNPDETAVIISPNTGTPGTVVSVTARNFPPMWASPLALRSRKVNPSVALMPRRTTMVW